MLLLISPPILSADPEPTKADKAGKADFDIPAFFDRAANTEDGNLYLLARNLVSVRGTKALPFLRKESTSRDWRRQWLAKAILQQLEKPELFRRWTIALRGFDVEFNNDDVTGESKLVLASPKGSEWDLQRSGTRVSKLEAKQKYGLKNGDPVPPEALAVAIDVLRGPGHNSSSVRERAYQVLARYADSPLAVAVVRYRRWNQGAFVIAAKRLGDALVPPLAELTKTDPQQMDLSQAEHVILGLGAIGSRASAEMLLDLLSDSRWHSQLFSIASSLEEILPPNRTGEFLELVQLYDRGQHLYGQLREVLIAVGAAALPALDAAAAKGSLHERNIAGGRRDSLGGDRDLHQRAI